MSTPIIITSLPGPTNDTAVPRSVTMRQARRALFAAGLYDSVDAAIAAIEDPSTRKAAQIEWEYSQEVHRDKDLVQMLAPALGLDDAALDQLFITASRL
ncbi:hypothetical protein [Herbaspirillum sp. ST 5-3]|uniref:hypothetical protein n=1 Tax=Oxalobacteraceae TaxID=75682 RepID=UPI0010A37E11|nr:hypothetical protein [Herbaspirillum sp. ST 5-3]